MRKQIAKRSARPLVSSRPVAELADDRARHRVTSAVLTAYSWPIEGNS